MKIIKAKIQNVTRALNRCSIPHGEEKEKSPGFLRIDVEGVSFSPRPHMVFLLPVRVMRLQNVPAKSGRVS